MNKTNSWYRLLIVLAIVAIGAIMDENTIRIQHTDHVAKPQPIEFDQNKQLV